jgi:hypothetical protein
MSTPEPLALTSADAMTILGVSRRTLSRLIASRKIIARRHSRTRIMIDARSVRDYFAGLPLVGVPVASVAPMKHVRAKRRP